MQRVCGSGRLRKKHSANTRLLHFRIRALHLSHAIVENKKRSQLWQANNAGKSIGMHETNHLDIFCKQMRCGIWLVLPRSLRRTDQSLAESEISWPSQQQIATLAAKQDESSGCPEFDCNSDGFLRCQALEKCPNALAPIPRM